eukprot:4855714-Heterocapsa_arctica.AAC.1
MDSPITPATAGPNFFRGLEDGERSRTPHLRRPWVEDTYESPLHSILHQPPVDIAAVSRGVEEAEVPTNDIGTNTRSFTDRPAQEAYPFSYVLGKR